MSQTNLNDFVEVPEEVGEFELVRETDDRYVWEHPDGREVCITETVGVTEYLVCLEDPDYGDELSSLLIEDGGKAVDFDIGIIKYASSADTLSEAIERFRDYVGDLE